MGPLDGTVALVTGGANGLGRAITQALVDSGARVGVLDLMTTDAFGPEVLTIVGDVAEDGAVASALEQLEQRWGPVSILVNDAADYPTAGLLEMSADAWRHVFDVNVTGMFLACQAFASRYVAAGLTRGRIVSISTGSVRSPRPRGAAYASSKAAVETIAATLAMELAPLGITSNVVSPGYIDVRGFSEAHPDRASDELRAQLTAAIPTGRAGRPADIAHAVRFLCLPDSDHVNAATIAVDGGSGAGRFTLPSAGAAPAPAAPAPAA
ncbi:MAG: SDR family NAD(P)-dependent oxidoreductase [Janthinobacterium lividum]